LNRWSDLNEAFCNSCVLPRPFDTLLRLEKWIKINEDIAYNATFALILTAAAPLDSKTCISMNIRTLPVIFGQHVVLGETMLLKVESQKSVGN